MPDNGNFGWNQGWLFAVMGEGEKASQEIEREADNHSGRKCWSCHIWEHELPNPSETYSV